MGMVFQHFNLFPHMTIMKNLTLAPTKVLKINKSTAEEKAQKLLERVGLGDRGGSYPAQLSGGQKQRIAIAGIIAMKPECMIFDESTAMLDPMGRRDVVNTIEKLNREDGKTVITITHYMDEAVRADRVIVINDGKIILDGPPAKIFAQSEILRSAGLDLPQCADLMLRLRKRGFELKGDINTPEMCAETLLAALKNDN